MNLELFKLPDPCELNKPNDYHLNKTQICENNGISLVHIWEDDWLYKRKIVESIILNKLGKSKKKNMLESVI